MTRMREGLSDILADERKLARHGCWGDMGSFKPAELAAFIGSETTKWVKVAKESGATAE